MQFNSLEDLCSGLNLPLKEVAATIEAYDAAAGAAAGGNGTPDAFGKTVFPSRFTAHVGTKGGAQGAGEPLYSAIVTPVLHYCMGGLAFDERGHVLKAPLAQGEGEAQRIIPGLLAAGEVTGTPCALGSCLVIFHSGSICLWLYFPFVFFLLSSGSSVL